MKRRFGIYAGTFDPLHAGHLSFARAALEQSQLDRIYFMPDIEPWGKQNVTPYTQRIRAVAQAIASDLQFMVLETTVLQFTAKEILPILQQQLGDQTFVLLVGSDVVLGSLEKWQDLGMLLQNFELAIGLRRHDSSVSITTQLQKIVDQTGVRPSYKIFRAPYSHLSSSGEKGLQMR